LLVNRGVLDGVFQPLKLCHFFEVYFLNDGGKGPSARRRQKRNTGILRCAQDDGEKASNRETGTDGERANKRLNQQEMAKDEQSR
jgi:hypothetical protein